VKKEFKLIVIFIVSLSFTLFVSCRKDEIRLVEEPGEKPLIPNSVVASLMQRTALNDGSIDNIIDKASCLLVKLPVGLSVNGIPLTIDSIDDYDVIEAIFDEDNMDVDALSISFPITITLEDYTEVLINSMSELNAYVSFCNGENEDDDDIECIDFSYPISVSTFNVLIDKLDTVTFYNDKELYEFIEDLNENEIVNVIFPTTLTFLDGTIVVVESLDALEMSIKNAIDTCDEDDDFDFDDDDNTNVTDQEFIDILINCTWEIAEIEIDDQDRKSQFNEFYFTFNSDGSATAKQNSTVYNGKWTLSTENGLRISIQFNDFPILNRTWKLHEINQEDDGARLDLRNLEDYMKLKNECE
jgi:hypothetical protein